MNKKLSFTQLPSGPSYLECKGCCDWLNELIEENKRLKEENSLLEKKNHNLVNMISRVQYRADLMKEQNEKLKKEFRKKGD